VKKEQKNVEDLGYELGTKNWNNRETREKLVELGGEKRKGSNKKRNQEKPLVERREGDKRRNKITSRKKLTCKD
jgi:hypothetical protein